MFIFGERIFSVRFSEALFPESQFPIDGLGSHLRENFLDQTFHFFLDHLPNQPLEFLVAQAFSQLLARILSCPLGKRGRLGRGVQLLGKVGKGCQEVI
jgi:hypothetical protein